MRELARCASGGSRVQHRTLPRIAIVEDDEVLTFLFREVCRSAGYEVAWQSTCVSDALAKLARDEPDVLLLDFALDGVRDGLEVLAVTSRRYPALTTVLATGWDFEKLAARIDYVAADRLMQKPILPSALSAILASIADERQAQTLARAA